MNNDNKEVKEDGKDNKYQELYELNIAPIKIRLVKDISIKIELIVKKGTIYPMWLRLIIIWKIMIKYIYTEYSFIS